MERKLCFKNSTDCWSLLALWDAELLKIIKPIDHEELEWKPGEKFEIENWSIKMNRLICKMYEYPVNFGIEEYAEKFKNISIYLVKKASNNIAGVLNRKFSGLIPVKAA